VRVPPAIGGTWQVWAEEVRRYLARAQSQLMAKDASATASEDGVILWDRVNGYPVVSKGGEFRQIVLADGYAVLAVTADVTAVAADTAYEIEFDVPTIIDGITLTGTPRTDITFLEAGLYSLSFTAQIASTTASTVNFWFWPKLNGSDVAGSAIKASLHNNGATTVVSRTAIFNLAANDVLNVMWAVSNTAGFLSEEAATAFAPETPAVTLAITRIRQ
jgi:hypothetical protein